MASNIKPLAPLAGYLRFFLKAFLAVQVLGIAAQVSMHYLQKSVVRHVESIKNLPNTPADSLLTRDEGQEGANAKGPASAAAVPEPTGAADEPRDPPVEEHEEEIARQLATLDKLLADLEANVEELEGVGRQVWWLQLDVLLLITALAAYFLLYLLTGVLFLRWVYRTYQNLRVFSGVDMKRSPSWAVWSYFVPIASFFVPPIVMEEMWVASHKSGSKGFTALWWLSAVALGFVGQFQKIDYAAQANPSEYMFLMSLGPWLLHLILTASTLVLVTRISGAYERKVIENLADANRSEAMSG